MPPTGSAHDAKPAFGERHFRDVLGEFATGVTIITTRNRDGRYVGFTANSFNAVSLKPPLVVWSLDSAANSRLAFEQCERYAISVLASRQVQLARRFSRPHADRFEGVPYALGWADAPLIKGAIAWLECRHFAWQPTGDHTLFVGEVVHCERHDPRPPLIFQRGRFCTRRVLREGKGEPD
jgi:flavin reductase (DIM6/NTAB) family NADH-FMN oxidoreductase RutF